jgi:hypothetical protein
MLTSCLVHGTWDMPRSARWIRSKRWVEPLLILTADLVNRHHMANVIPQRHGTAGTITNSM